MLIFLVMFIAIADMVKIHDLKKDSTPENDLSKNYLYKSLPYHFNISVIFTFIAMKHSNQTCYPTLSQGKLIRCRKKCKKNL